MSSGKRQATFTTAYKEIAPCIFQKHWFNINFSSFVYRWCSVFSQSLKPGISLCNPQPWVSNLFQVTHSADAISSITISSYFYVEITVDPGNILLPIERASKEGQGQCEKVERSCDCWDYLWVGACGRVTSSISFLGLPRKPANFLLTRNFIDIYFKSGCQTHQAQRLDELYWAGPQASLNQPEVQWQHVNTISLYPGWAPSAADYLCAPPSHVADGASLVHSICSVWVHCGLDDMALQARCGPWAIWDTPLLHYINLTQALDHNNKGWVQI